MESGNYMYQILNAFDVDGTEYVQFTERNSWLSEVRLTVTVTLTAGSQNRIFSLIYSDPNKKNVLSQRYSSFLCVDLDPYVRARIYFEEYYCSLFITAEYDVYKQMSSETP